MVASIPRLLPAHDMAGGPQARNYFGLAVLQ
jgi:hypothetical protein